MSVPYTQRRNVQFRGPSHSDDYNKRIEENYKDLVVLMNKARVSDVELDELYRRLAKDNLSMARVLTDLEQRIASLEGSENRVTFFSSEHIDNDNFDSDPEYAISVEDRCTLDTQHGLLTLPQIVSSSLSKLFFTDTQGNETLPSTLEMRVVGSEDTAEVSANVFIDTSEPQYSLYRRPGLIWERNVVAESPHINGSEVVLYVKAPTDLFTTANSNNLLIHAFPQFGATIRDISYTLRPDPVLRESDGYTPFNSMGHYAGELAAVDWVVPGGWTGGDEGADAVLQAAPKSFHFKAMPITAIRITLHQDNYFQEAGKYIYTYGLSRLDLRYNKYLREGKTIIRVDAPDGGNISQILNVQPQIWNVHPAELSSVFSYRTIWETSPGSGSYQLDPVPFSERMWIEVTLRNTESWSPALSGLIVDFE